MMSNIGGEKCLENSGGDAKVLRFWCCFGCASLGAAGHSHCTLADGGVNDVQDTAGLENGLHLLLERVTLCCGS